MKRLLCYLFVGSCSLSCTQSTEPEATSARTLSVTQTDLDAPPVYTLKVRKSFTDIPTNIRQFCTPSLTHNCARELHDLQLELTALNPLPVPQPNTDPTISVAEADRLYREFAAAHRGEPIGILFQQYFSRILLNKYGVLTSQHYPLLAYYAQQLIDANSYDLVTQANALTRLRPHLPAAEFDRLRQTATANARTFLPEHTQQLTRRLDDLAHPPFEFLEPEESRAARKAQLEAEDQAIRQAVAQLEQLQGGPVNTPR